MGRIGNYASIFVGSWLAAAVLAPAQAADPAFQSWLEEVWPQAQALGVSRATFDAATRGLEPDLTLPDLDLPGRQAPPRGRPSSCRRRPTTSRRRTSPTSPSRAKNSPRSTAAR